MIEKVILKIRQKSKKKEEKGNITIKIVKSKLKGRMTSIFDL